MTPKTPGTPVAMLLICRWPVLTEPFQTFTIIYYLHVQAKSLDRLGFWFCFIPSLGSWLSKLPSWTACQCPPGSPGSWSVELGVYRTRFIMGLLYYIITNIFILYANALLGHGPWFFGTRVHEGLLFAIQVSFRKGFMWKIPSGLGS